MKRSSLLLLLLLVLLAGLSAYLIWNKSGYSTVEHEDRNFQVTDTLAINKIFLADKEGNHSTLTREKSGWFVNGKYKCRSEAILNLLEAIRLVEVKMPVPKQAKENVLRFMSSNAIKVEVYAEDEKIKQYYVGHEPSDSDGSYLLLTKPGSEENYKDPYICGIPGFKGILQPRFITRENEWRDRLVINFTPPELKQIRLKYFGVQSDSSFQIDFISNSQFNLINSKGAQLSYDMAKMRQYLIYFQNISYEVLITGKDRKLQDSLTSVSPFAELTVSTKTEGDKVYKFYRKPFSGNINPELGTVFEFDPDRFYMNFDNKMEWALVQYFVFGKLLVPFTYFEQGASVKK